MYVSRQAITSSTFREIRNKSQHLYLKKMHLKMRASKIVANFAQAITC